MQKQRPGLEYISRGERRAEVHNQSVKGMLILNGGAMLSLLTFLTQVLNGSAGNLQELIRPVTWSLIFFSVGLVSAAMINYFRYENSRYSDKLETRAKGMIYGKAHRSLFWI